MHALCSVTCDSVSCFSIDCFSAAVQYVSLPRVHKSSNFCHMKTRATPVDFRNARRCVRACVVSSLACGQLHTALQVDAKSSFVPVISMSYSFCHTVCLNGSVGAAFLTEQSQQHHHHLQQWHFLFPCGSHRTGECHHLHSCQSRKLQPVDCEQWHGLQLLRHSNKPGTTVHLVSSGS